MVPGSSQVVQVVKNLPANAGDSGRRCEFDPWVRKIPWSKKWLPNSTILFWRFYGQRGLVSHSLWGHKRARFNWAQVAPRSAESSLAFFLTPCWHSREVWLRTAWELGSFIFGSPTDRLCDFRHITYFLLNASLKPECLICRIVC